jgi:hypothetical protein
VFGIKASPVVEMEDGELTHRGVILEMDLEALANLRDNVSRDYGIYFNGVLDRLERPSLMSMEEFKATKPQPEQDPLPGL